MIDRRAGNRRIYQLDEGPDRTRVELEHRNLERHGEGWEQMRDAVGSDGGWDGGLRAFAKRLAG